MDAAAAARGSVSLDSIAGVSDGVIAGRAQ